MRISVVTITLNRAATLQRTMESVLAQTHPDVEHIIVDGGSTDGTADVVRSMEPRYGTGRLRWVSEPDGGIYDALNKGLRMATGHVVGLLHSDDFFSGPDVLERVAATMDCDAAAEAVFGDVHYVRETDPQRCVRYYSGAGLRRGHMLMGIMPPHPSFYCRREVVERYGPYRTDIGLASDFEFMLRMLYVHRVRARYLPVDMVTMTVGGASTSGLRNHLRMLADIYRAFAIHRLPAGFLLAPLRYPAKLPEYLCRLRRQE